MNRLLFFLGVAVILTSCEEKIRGNGNVKEETRESAPFHSIDVSGAYKVYITPDNYSSIRVKADENLLEHIETYVKNSTLHVKSKAGFDRYRSLDLYITMQELQELDASGATEIQNEGVLQGEDVELKFSGAVEADLNINSKNIDGDFSGACDVILQGNTKKMELETSGAVEVMAENFKTETCRLKMSGAGKATVFVTQKLDIKVSGAAEVNYKGNPGEVKQDVSGAANINKI